MQRENAANVINPSKVTSPMRDRQAVVKTDDLDQLAGAKWAELPLYPSRGKALIRGRGLPCAFVVAAHIYVAVQKVKR